MAVYRFVEKHRASTRRKLIVVLEISFLCLPNIFSSQIFSPLPNPKGTNPRGSGRFTPWRLPMWGALTLGRLRLLAEVWYRCIGISSALQGFFDGQAPLNAGHLKAIMVLNVSLRMAPIQWVASEPVAADKSSCLLRQGSSHDSRSLYFSGGHVEKMTRGYEMWRGLYQWVPMWTTSSMCLSLWMLRSVRPGFGMMTVNIDVSNGIVSVNLLMQKL